MAQHITRKELKKDAIREKLVHGAEAVASHQRQFWLYGGVALIVIIGALGWRFYSQNQTTRASVALSDAMKIYQARIRTVNEPAAPEEITYVDEKNKYNDAAKQFADAATRYSRTRPGQLARYYAALSLVQLQRDDEAEKDLKALESSNDPGLAAMSRFQLAQLYSRTGKGDQAVQIFQQLSENPNLFVPKPVVLLALADHYSASNPEQAAKVYTQVKTEFPDTPAAETADRRLQLLSVKG